MKTQKMIRAVGVIAAALFGLSLAACNTVQGAGEDIEDAGEAVEDAADG